MTFEKCPTCKRRDMLVTPRNPITIDDKRSTEKSGIRKCKRCDLFIPSGKNSKFWNGKEAVGMFTRGN